MISRCQEIGEFNAAIAEKMTCLMWVCSLQGFEDTGTRAHDLRKTKGNAKTTPKQLTLQIQLFLNIREDSKHLAIQHHFSS